MQRINRTISDSEDTSQILESFHNFDIMRSVSKYIYYILAIWWLRNRSTAQNKIERMNQKTDDKAVLFVRSAAPGNLILFKYMSFARIAHVLTGSEGRTS